MFAKKYFQLSSLLLFCGLIGSSNVNASETNLPALKLLALKRPIVVAHRGFSKIAPENTLPAFQFAVTAGADLVELDYHHSKDGVPVVIHDPTLDRTTDAIKLRGGTKIKVADKTLAEIKTLDAGSWLDAKYKGARIPTLVEALDMIQSSGGMTVIEHKAGDAATCVKILREKNLINQLVVHSFHWDYLRDFHKLAPEQVLIALGPPGTHEDGTKLSSEEKFLSAKWLDGMKDTGAHAVHWNQNVTKESVKLAHKRGLKVWIYTIDDPALANQLLDMGVDGITSNNTSLIWKTLALRFAQTAK
jgi:glycerophosphoryl diester phosphodiesterase